jgi:hypothetical protein
VIQKYKVYTAIPFYLSNTFEGHLVDVELNLYRSMLNTGGTAYILYYLAAVYCPVLFIYCFISGFGMLMAARPHPWASHCLLKLLLAPLRAALMGTATIEGAQPKDWKGHFLVNGYCKSKQSINNFDAI